MLIKAINIESEIAIKLYEKHSVFTEEVEQVLKERKTLFKKVGGNQYVALGLWNRYLTIFFTYDSKTKEATITTTYPSSRKQIHSYKKLIK